MKKILVTMMILALTIAAQAQRDTIGVSQFTAIYRYECKTMDAEGNRQKKGRFRIVDGCQAAHMHMGTFFMNYPEGRITAQEMLYPHRYQTDETLDKQKWVLTDAQDSIFGYACQSAKAKYHGLTWNAYYTEDIPSSIGPWKLGGLPGIITKATDAMGIHTFTLCGLLKEEQPIVFAEYVTWIVPDGRGKFTKQRVDYQKLKASKFLAYKKKVLGNSRYLQNPTYYAPDPMEAFGYVETSYNSAGDNVRSVAGVVIVSNPHQYQPLEQ